MDEKMMFPWMRWMFQLHNHNWKTYRLLALN
ncbi:hypothetical protein Golax_004664 [Gossypium laxum]|uniref:Uncharacterized protein n=1 Tax=Gossypium laxum TaxID=34288 RepID=A0A7J9B3G8_9ROSI|nr:hypothetical protein [Gossypium laxum]